MEHHKVHAQLVYPRSKGHGVVREVHVELVDTRAAPDLIISYDFARDGYIIRMRKETDDGHSDPQEVAFIASELEAQWP